MSSDFVRLGPEAKVRVNGQIYAVTEGRYRIVADEADTTDTEAWDANLNRGFKRNKGGLEQMEVDLTAQVADDVSPHVGPLNIKAGDTIDLALHPKGMVNDRYYAPFFRVFSFEGDFRVQGSNPQTIKFSGKSDDDFFVFGEFG